MSRSYKDIRRWKTKQFWENYYKHHKSVIWLANSNSRKDVYEFIGKNPTIYKNSEQLFFDFGSAPSWFVNLFMTKPKRRKEKKLINQFMKYAGSVKELSTIEDNCQLWPLFKKPFVYYW